LTGFRSTVAPCYDFHLVPDAGVASCTTCTGSARAACTAGACAAGFFDFVDGDDTSTKCTGGASPPPPPPPVHPRVRACTRVVATK
jgi:hypothetical protein